MLSILDHRQASGRRLHHAADGCGYGRGRFFQPVHRAERGALRFDGPAGRAPTVNFGVFINNIISFMIARQGGSLAPRRPAQPRGSPPSTRKTTRRVRSRSLVRHQTTGAGDGGRDQALPAALGRFLCQCDHYLIAGNGAALGSEIGQKFGTPAGTLFEVSIKSNLLILLYQSGEDQGR